MRPRKLIIEGLRSYRQRQEITFTDGLFAITGQTGSGKSSILEAIVFALYGSSTFDARNPKALVSDRCDEMTVSLEFLLRRERYQVTRCFSMSGRNSMHELKGPQGEILAAKSSDVDRAVEELLGLSCEDFLKTVVLPQGAFQSLLHSTPSQRTPLLKNLLGLFQLDELAERVAAEKQRLATLVQLGRSQRQMLPASPAELAESLRSQRDSAAARLQGLQEQVEILQSLQRLQDDQQRLQQDVQRRLAQLQGLCWPQDWDELSAVEKALLAREERLAGEESQHQVDLEALRQAERPDLEPNRLRSLDKRHQSLLQRQSLWQQEVARQSEEQEQMSLSLGSLSQAQEESELKLADLARARVELEQVRLALLDSEQRCKELQDVAAREQRLGEQRQRLLEQRHTAQRACEEQGEQARFLQLGLEQTRAEAARVGAELHEVERISGVEALCSDMHEGQPCPVCARELPSGWHLPHADGLEQLREACRAVDQRLRAQEQELAQVRARLGLLQRQLEQADREIAAAEEQLQGLRPRGPQLASVLAQQVEEVERHKAEHQRRAAHSSALQAELDMGRKQLERERAQLGQSQRRLEQGQERLRGEEEQLQRLRHQLVADLGGEDLAARLAALEEEAALLHTRRRELQEVSQSLQQRRQALGLERRQRLDKPFEELRGLLHTAYARLDLSDLPPPRSEWTLTQWREASLTWQEHSRQHQQQLQQRLLEEEERHSATRQRLSQLLTTLGRDSVASVGQELEQHRQSVWELERRLTLLEEERARLERLNAKLQPAEERLVHLEAVHELLGNKTGKDKRLSFTQWVLQQRQDQLLQLASHTFQQISAGQFGFSADFQILDLQSGLDRKPITLSGGETFLASLALALSLSELVARKGGRLEAFFIDEGFGSLSPECLDRAMTALEVLANSGRTIGVISHVPLMAERIEQVWMVTRTPMGSRIEILSEELRKRMLQADLRAFEAANHPLFAGS